MKSPKPEVLNFLNPWYSDCNREEGGTNRQKGPKFKISSLIEGLWGFLKRASGHRDEGLRIFGRSASALRKLVAIKDLRLLVQVCCC